MRSYIKYFALLFVTSLTLVSCHDDIDDFVDASSSINGTVGRNGDGSGNDGRYDDRNNEVDISNIPLAWNQLFLDLDQYAEGMRPNATARALGYIHLAAYETAIPVMPNMASNSNLLEGFNIHGNVDEDNLDLDLALNAAYAKVLDHFIINLPRGLRNDIEELEQSIERTEIRGVDRESAEASIQWGRSVARQVIEYAQTDSEAEQQITEPQPLSYEPPTGDGYWTYSAEEERGLFPYWKSVRTFIISEEETSSIPPIAYSSEPGSDYFAQMQEVYDSNNEARDTDNEDLWIAEFWSDDVTGLTFSPPARQYAIAAQLVDQYDLDIQETLYLFLKLGLSLNDAAVSTWADKYEYMVMRPNVFIHEFIDPSFQTNLFRLIPWPNPTFPGYPSGHSCFASAAAGVFIDFFGNATDFTDRSHEGRTEFRSTPRTYNTFEQMAAENGYSRIPLGVHIRMDCTEGLRLGYEIADAINAYNLRLDGI